MRQFQHSPNNLRMPVVCGFYSQSTLLISTEVTSFLLFFFLKFYIFFFYKDVIGVKLYSDSLIENVDQDDERVIDRKKKLLQSGIVTELDNVRGKSVLGHILFFPEYSFYQFSKCLSCRITAPIRRMTMESEICENEGCLGKLKSCYKVDVKFLNSKTSEVIHLTGFDQTLSPYETMDVRDRANVDQPLEAKFAKLMGTPLTVFYKSNLKRNGSGLEPSLIIDSIKVE